MLTHVVTTCGGLDSASYVRSARLLLLTDRHRRPFALTSRAASTIRLAGRRSRLARIDPTDHRFRSRQLDAVSEQPERSAAHLERFELVPQSNLYDFILSTVTTVSFFVRSLTEAMHRRVSGAIACNAFSVKERPPLVARSKRAIGSLKAM
jgi:hypothetical protein